MISWQTCTPETEQLFRADCLSIEAQFVCKQMQWCEHLIHMEEAFQGHGSIFCQGGNLEV